MNPLQQTLFDTLMQTRKYLTDMRKHFSECPEPTTRLEKELKEVYDSFDSFMHSKTFEMDWRISFHEKSRNEEIIPEIILSMVKKTFQYVTEIHRIFLRWAKKGYNEYDYTRLEVLLRNETDNLWEFIDKGAKGLEEKTKSKGKRSKLKKRETLKKMGHTWVKGKGAVVTKEVYSPPKHKYGLRSIHKIS